MGAIHTSDIIYATLSQHGREIAAYRFSGMTTMADLLRQICKAAAGCIGLVNVRLRNSTQGWTLARSLMLAPTAASVQLSLF